MQSTDESDQTTLCRAQGLLTFALDWGAWTAGDVSTELPWGESHTPHSLGLDTLCVSWLAGLC